ncbi:MAG: hypothetical protein ACFE0R_13665 [Salinarimonas sp.]
MKRVLHPPAKEIGVVASLAALVSGGRVNDAGAAARDARTCALRDRVLERITLACPAMTAAILPLEERS